MQITKENELGSCGMSCSGKSSSKGIVQGRAGLSIGQRDRYHEGNFNIGPRASHHESLSGLFLLRIGNIHAHADRRAL